MHDKLINTRLKDGTPVLIRLLRPDDKDCLNAGFEKLSVESRRMRFISPPCRLTDSQLKYLTEIDNVNHLAWGVHDMSDDSRPGIGVARYIRLEEDPDKAEFAVTVIDEHQHKGLGTILTDLLIRSAQQNGIKYFTGYMLEGNTSMMNILKHLGAKVKRYKGTLLQVDLNLTELI